VPAGPAKIDRRGSRDSVTAGPLVFREAKVEAAHGKAPGAAAVIVTERATSPASLPISSRPHVVQAGAFRQDSNARQLIDRLQRGGERPFTVTARGLPLVYIGPFPVRRDALAANKRLQRAGFEGFVTRL
jgi:cell division protein FtsN